MKVLFVYLNQLKENFYQGIACISSVLKTAGHETDLLILTDFDKKKIDSKIERFKPDIIGVSSTTDQITLAIITMNHIYKNFKIPIVLGGTHATLCPEDVIELESLMAVCIGEGEYPMLDLVGALSEERDYRSIANFWFRDGSKIIRNGTRNLIEDLDSLPSPDYEIFDAVIRDSSDLPIMAGRGCPYSCPYCLNNYLSGLHVGKGRYVRFCSVKRLLVEIEKLLSKYHHINEVHFTDDTFTADRIWLEEFCEEYPKRFKTPFSCNARVNLVDEELVKMLKEAGCRKIFMAIESGNERIRRDVLKRYYSNEDIMKAFNLFKRYDIVTSTFNMIGVPMDTESTIDEAIRLNKKIGVDMLQVSIFKPYPKTELYYTCEKNGWLTDQKNVSFIQFSTLKLPTISPERITYRFSMFSSDIFDHKALNLLKRIILRLLFVTIGYRMLANLNINLRKKFRRNRQLRWVKDKILKM